MTTQKMIGDFISHIIRFHGWSSQFKDAHKIRSLLFIPFPFSLFYQNASKIRHWNECTNEANRKCYRIIISNKKSVTNKIGGFVASDKTTWIHWQIVKFHKYSPVIKSAFDTIAVIVDYWVFFLSVLSLCFLIKNHVTFLYLNIRLPNIFLFRRFLGSFGCLIKEIFLIFYISDYANLKKKIEQNDYSLHC